MSEYIINPMFFYWMQVADNVRDIMIIGVLVLIVLIIGLIVLWFLSITEEEKSSRKKFVKMTSVLLVICCIGSTLIPSKETLIEMTIAKIATVENTQNAVEAIKEATDYVFEKI